MMLPNWCKPTTWFKRTVDNNHYDELPLKNHQWGEISTAAAKSNIISEGYSQSESGLMGTHQFGPYGTFVGIYDGHGGTHAAEFAKDHFFKIMKSSMSKVTEMSANILDESLSQLDKKYRMQDKDKSAAKAESCCMVAIIILGQIYIANAGDAKVVLGRLVRPKGRVRLILERWARLTPHIQAIPLLAGEHPILQFPREELELMHPMDHSILHYSDKSLAKGLIPTKRSVIDMYLNKKTGILHAPTLFQDELLPEDKFIIFGSSELWRYLKNEEAVAMVRKLSRRGIAMKLVKKALMYKELKKLTQSSNHDNILAVVLFLDHNRVSAGTSSNHLSAIYYEKSSSPDRDSELEKFGVKYE